MPNATLRDVSVDPALTNVSVMHTIAARDMVHGSLFPAVPVDHEDGFYFVFNRDDMLRIDAQERRPGSRFARKGLGISKEQLALRQYGLETMLPREERNSKDSPLAAGTPKIMSLTQDLLLQRENQFMGDFVNSGGATPWDNTDQAGVASSPSANQFIRWNAAGATPIADVKAWIRIVQIACGRKPNVLMLDPQSFDYAAEASGVLSRLPDDATRDVTKQVFAALCGLDEVVVSEAVYNTANEGATYSGSFSSPAATGLLVYRTQAPAREEVSAGYVFSWTEFDEVRADVGESGGFAVTTYWDDATRSDIYQASSYYQMRIVTPSAGVRITGIYA